jgi:hypothetical protein
MEIPCDTIGEAVASYLDAGDLTPANRTTYVVSLLLRRPLAHQVQASDACIR